MVELEDIKGIKMVGYRYGEAPEVSWNYAENKPENGVSMASVGYITETDRTKAEFGDRKRFYYSGVISDTGGDDEFCMDSLTQISYQQYLSMKKSLIKESNLLVDYKCDLKKWAKNQGWDICMTYEEIEKMRKKFKK